ncbi:MAG: class I SAM-dependent methyltransferase [Magnetospiraceae bacterium]
MSRGEAFIRDNTAIDSPPLVPELRFHLATEIAPIWKATEVELQRVCEPPFWAFCWPGGQALARYILDNPDQVAGKRVLDFASGCGIAGFAAAKAGAYYVLVNDVDPMAMTAIALNGALNGVSVETHGQDLVGAENPGWDLVLAGDICYEQPLAGRVKAWLQELAQSGAEVWLADPGRAYAPDTEITPLVTYTVPTSLELEDQEKRVTTLYRVG